MGKRFWLKNKQNRTVFLINFSLEIALLRIQRFTFIDLSLQQTLKVIFSCYGMEGRGWKEKTFLIRAVYFQNARSAVRDIYCLFHTRKMFLRNGNVASADIQ